MIIVSMGIAVFGPSYEYIIYGHRTTLFSFKIPFFVEDSNLEFGINIVLQIIMGVTGFIGNVGLEGYSALFIDSISVSSKITKLQYEILSKKLISQQLTQMKMKMETLRILNQIRTVDQ